MLSILNGGLFQENPPIVEEKLVDYSAKDALQEAKKSLPAEEERKRVEREKKVKESIERVLKEIKAKSTRGSTNLMLFDQTGFSYRPSSVDGLLAKKELIKLGYSVQELGKNTTKSEILIDWSKESFK